MRVSILLQITDDDGVAGAAQEVAAFDKATERPEDLGLLIAEGKALLSAVQHRTITAQVTAWSAHHCRCEVCGERRRIKGYYPIAFHTLYGDIELRSPRLNRCACQSTGPASVSPLRDFISGHIAPERLYLEARWASLVPYAAAAGLLADILPITAGANATTVRAHVLKVAEHVETELQDERPSLIDGCEADWQHLPIPEGRSPSASMAAMSATGQTAKATSNSSSVARYPKIGRRRTWGSCMATMRNRSVGCSKLLKSQGLQANQDVTFLTDGGDEIRALTEWVTPASEHVLDWFHIAMRLTVLSQYARGIAHHDEVKGAGLLKSIERMKWLLWHGNLQRAEKVTESFEEDVDVLETDYPNLRKFARFAREFTVYIKFNANSLINYGERYRAGERISSSLAESTVNAVISKRFAKRQQMQWTPRGAHLLLQTRTRALDGTLRPLFERWHPGLAAANQATFESVPVAA
jgi:hypothetical protein